MNDRINNSDNAAAPLALWQALLLSAITALTASFAAFVGSGFFMCISGVLFAFALCRRNTFIWCSAPAAYVLGLLLIRSPLLSLTSLLFLAIGLPFAACIKRRCSLSVTTAALSVAAAVVLASLFAAAVVRGYGDLVRGFSTYFDEMKASVNEVLNAFRDVTDENGFVIFSDQTVAAIKESLIMTAPAMAIIVCEAAAYITAKMFLLLCNVFKDSELVHRPWRVHTSLAASIVFTLSYLVFVFAPRANIVYYSAANLMFILIPLTSISGFHAMFGDHSSFRTSQRSGTRILLISTCVVFFFISPVLLLAMFSFWGAFDGIRLYMKKRINENEDDRP